MTRCIPEPIETNLWQGATAEVESLTVFISRVAYKIVPCHRHSPGSQVASSTMVPLI